MQKRMWCPHAAQRVLGSPDFLCPTDAAARRNACNWPAHDGMHAIDLGALIRLIIAILLKYWNCVEKILGIEGLAAKRLEERMLRCFAVREGPDGQWWVICIVCIKCIISQLLYITYCAYLVCCDIFCILMTVFGVNIPVWCLSILTSLEFSIIFV